MDVQRLPNAAHVAMHGMGGEQRVDIGPRQIRIGDDRLRHPMRAGRVGERLQPRGLLQRLGRIVRGVDVDDLPHIDPFGIGEEVTHLVGLQDRIARAHEVAARARHPRIAQLVEIPQMDVRIDNLEHGYCRFTNMPPSTRISAPVT